MREMNYYPNANAQSFASGSNHTVVLLANLAPNAAFQNPHMFEIISGLEEALCKRGYRLILRGADATSACALRRRSFPAAVRTPLRHVGVMSLLWAAVLTRLHFPTSFWAHRTLTARYVGSTTAILTPGRLPRASFCRGGISGLLLSAENPMIWVPPSACRA